MEKKVQEQIEHLELNIKWTEEALETAVNEFRDAAAKYDAYGIDEFIDGYVRRVRDYRKQLAQLNDQKRMLVWLASGKEEK